MAETTEREKRQERSAGFTDGAYIPRDEAPKMPRVFSNADMVEPKEPERRTVSLSMTGMLCILFLFLGIWLGSTQKKVSLPTAEAEALPRVTAAPAATAAVSAAARTEVGAEESPCLGITVQTVTAAAAEFYQLYYDDRLVQGVQIYAVGDDRAADLAGLRAGDILVAISGVPVPTAADLTQTERCYRAGEEAVCLVYRDGDLLEVPVVFEKRTAENAGLDW